MDEKIIARALRMLENRAEWWDGKANEVYDNIADETAATAKAVAYDSAVAILRYAIEGNADCVAQFSYK